jgi:hypothetical protein
MGRGIETPLAHVHRTRRPGGGTGILGLLQGGHLSGASLALITRRPVRTFYAVKRLSRSDLSFFRYHYGVDATHQKSINLNAAVFNPMFPGLDRGTFHPVDLHLIGPVDAPAERLQRKVVRSASSKNWRLDGEFVVDPEVVPDRYHRLTDADYAIFKFEGDEQPAVVRCLLVSRADSPERYSAVRDLMTSGGVTEPSMRALTREMLESLGEAFNAEAPGLGFLLDDALKEGLELGGGPVEQRGPGPVRAGVGPAVDREAADAFGAAFAETGRRGEGLIAGLLDLQREAGLLSNYRWVSLTNAYAPFDFEATLADGSSREIEVKTTTNDYEQPIFVSTAEAARLVEKGESYNLYRVYGLTDEGAWMAPVDGLSEPLAAALAAVDGLPAGVATRGFAIDLRVLGERRDPVRLESTIDVGETGP